MDAVEGMPVRTLLVSDVHLGHKHAQAKEFLKFLRGFSPETVYIVGDFIDGWKINSGWCWCESCDAIIDHLIEIARKHTKIFYIPGNHDSFLRNPAFRSMLPERLPEFEVANEFVLESLAGYRFLVTHGDRFDFFETRAQWVSKATAGLYDACLSLNWWLHRLLPRRHGNPYGFCARLKDRVKRGVRFISNFENQIMRHAHVRSCHGVICGHIHTPDIVHSSTKLYCNTGDWMENCTGLVEHHDGNIELVSRYSANRTLCLTHSERDHASPGEGSSELNDQFSADLARDGVAA
jgi:UDP-2,3-diacylglucosamine pyrophosphatase LpxH